MASKMVIVSSGGLGSQSRAPAIGRLLQRKVLMLSSDAGLDSHSIAASEMYFDKGASGLLRGGACRLDVRQLTDQSTGE